MTHTLAAVFDNRVDAERARSALLGVGFKDSDVRLSEPAPGDESTQPEAGTGTSIGGSIKHFFTRLFGEDDDENWLAYSEAIQRGNTVLTVQAGNLDEVEQAADIVEGYGPIDIDERKNSWTAGGWSWAAKAPTGGGQYLGAQGKPLMQEEINVVNRSVLRGGARIYERVISSIRRPGHPRSGDDDEAGGS